jgi:RNA polymerase sigma-70 factor, ECF subfamily
MNQPDDFLLISRVILFDEKSAFDKLVKKHQSAIRRFFLHITLGNKELSDDLSQETFIKVYLNLRSFKGTARFSTWLYRIAYNTFYDHLKTNHREFHVDDIFEISDKQSSYSISEQIGKNIDIFESLKLLRKEERIAVTLFYMEDLTHEKIASIMQCPLGTVKTHILRGKEKLSTYFKKSGYEHAIA